MWNVDERLEHTEHAPSAKAMERQKNLGSAVVLSGYKQVVNLMFSNRQIGKAEEQRKQTKVKSDVFRPKFY